MNRDKIVELLRGYVISKGRVSYLIAEKQNLKRQYQRMRKEQIDAMASPRAQVISDMPRASGTHDKVGDLAARLADGWESDELYALRQKIERIERETGEAVSRCSYVEGWLNALPEREEYVVRAQLVNGLRWADVIDGYTERFGIEMSKDTMKRTRARGLWMIGKMCE